MAAIPDKPKTPKKKGGSKPRGSSLKGLRIVDSLSPQQEAYARARAMGMSAQEAIDSAQAGVGLSTAYKWDQTPAISNRIAELSALASKNAILKTGLDRQWVIERLMTITERCMQAEPVMEKIDGELVPTGEYKFDSMGATRALQLLGSELGMFKPRDEKPGDEYANLSDDDLTRIASDLAAQVGIIEAGSGDQAQAGSQQVIEIQAVPKAD